MFCSIGVLKADVEMSIKKPVMPWGIISKQTSSWPFTLNLKLLSGGQCPSEGAPTCSHSLHEGPRLWRAGHRLPERVQGPAQMCSLQLRVGYSQAVRLQVSLLLVRGQSGHSQKWATFSKYSKHPGERISPNERVTSYNMLCLIKNKVGSELKILRAQTKGT